MSDQRPSVFSTINTLGHDQSPKPLFSMFVNVIVSPHIWGLLDFTYLQWGNFGDIGWIDQSDVSPLSTVLAASDSLPLTNSSKR